MAAENEIHAFLDKNNLGQYLHFPVIAVLSLLPKVLLMLLFLCLPKQSPYFSLVMTLLSLNSWMSWTPYFSQHGQTWPGSVNVKGGMALRNGIWNGIWNGMRNGMRNDCGMARRIKF